MSEYAPRAVDAAYTVLRRCQDKRPYAPLCRYYDDNGCCHGAMVRYRAVIDEHAHAVRHHARCFHAMASRWLRINAPPCAPYCCAYQRGRPERGARAAAERARLRNTMPL